MFFRFTKKKDRERYREAFVQHSDLDVTQEPEVLAFLAAPKQADPRKKDSNGITPTLATPMKEAIDDEQPTKRTPPQGSPNPKATPQKKPKLGSIQAGLILATEAENLEDNGKKYAQEAEKAMRACVASLVITTGHSSQVATNIEKFSEWSWLKETHKFYEPFVTAMANLEEYKSQKPLVRKFLVTDLSSDVEFANAFGLLVSQGSALLQYPIDHSSKPLGATHKKLILGSPRGWAIIRRPLSNDTVKLITAQQPVFFGIRRSGGIFAQIWWPPKPTCFPAGAKALPRSLLN